MYEDEYRESKREVEYLNYEFVDALCFTFEMYESRIDQCQTAINMEPFDWWIEFMKSDVMSL